MRRRMWAIWAILLLPGICGAGSIFSVGGVGLINNNSGARDAGMGSLGLGLADTGAVGSLNPALWAGTNVSRFSSGAMVIRFVSRDHTGEDVSDDFTLQFVALGICLKPGLTLGFRFHQESRVDFRRVEFETLGSQQYKNFNIWKGGVSIGSIIVAGRVNAKFWLGGGMDLIFGSLNTLWGVDFASTTISDAQFTLSDQMLGARPRIGFYYAPNEKSSLGILAVSGAQVKVTEELDYSYSDSTSSQNLKLKFPTTVGLGYAFPFTERVKGTIDFMWSGWEQKGQDIGDANRYQQAQFLDLGAELTPLTEPLAPFVKKITYRAGIKFRNLYYQYPDGETVGEATFSLGCGIPLKAQQGRMDINFDIGKRGNLKLNGAEELFFGCGIYFNSGEKWFVRQKKY